MIYLQIERVLFFGWVSFILYIKCRHSIDPDLLIFIRLHGYLWSVLIWQEVFIYSIKDVSLKMEYKLCRYSTLVAHASKPVACLLKEIAQTSRVWIGNYIDAKSVITQS